MKKGRLIRKGIYIGIGIFIISRLFSRFCFLLFNMFEFHNTSFLSLKYYLSYVVNIVYIACRPLSTIFAILEVDLFKSSSIFLKYAVFIFRGLDLVFWVSLSVLILYIRKPKSRI